MRPDVAAEADGEEATIFVRHLHKLGKERDTRLLSTRALVSFLVKSPKLFGIVPSEEIRIVLEEIFKSVEVSVLDMCVSATGWLASKPHAVLLANGSP